MDTVTLVLKTSLFYCGEKDWILNCGDGGGRYTQTHPNELEGGCGCGGGKWAWVGERP